MRITRNFRYIPDSEDDETMYRKKIVEPKGVVGELVECPLPLLSQCFELRLSVRLQNQTSANIQGKN